MNRNKCTVGNRASHHEFRAQWLSWATALPGFSIPLWSVVQTPVTENVFWVLTLWCRASTGTSRSVEDRMHGDERAAGGWASHQELGAEWLSIVGIAGGFDGWLDARAGSGLGVVLSNLTNFANMVRADVGRDRHVKVQ